MVVLIFYMLDTFDTLRRAKDQCDLLFVSVTGDRFVNKGAGRPVIFENERAEIISSLKSVSGVVINQAYSSEERS